MYFFSYIFVRLLNCNLLQSTLNISYELIRVSITVKRLLNADSLLSPTFDICLLTQNSDGRATSLYCLIPASYRVLIQHQVQTQQNRLGRRKQRFKKGGLWLDRETPRPLFCSLASVLIYPEMWVPVQRRDSGTSGSDGERVLQTEAQGAEAAPLCESVATLWLTAIPCSAVYHQSDCNTLKFHDVNTNLQWDSWLQKSTMTAAGCFF